MAFSFLFKVSVTFRTHCVRGQRYSDYPDQKPHSVVSDLGPHCLLMSIKRTLGLYGLKNLPMSTVNNLQQKLKYIKSI